jgi:hypothetical protein
MLWTAGVLLGLAVRLAFLRTKGTADMDVYLQWGRDVGQYGLAAAYHGIYFPLQYEVFHVAVQLMQPLSIQGVTAIKGINLIFDLASFGVLVLLLGRLGLPRAYALLYWLHPFFLAIFWLGYIDPQVGFLLLSTLLGLTYARTPVHFLAAGVPLGLAIVMKPQADLFVVVLVILVGVGLLGRRLGLAPASREFARRVALVFVAPAVVYVACSAVLAAGGQSLTYFAHTNLPSQLALVSPSLTANAPNIWYPIAEAGRAADAPNYTVTEPAILNSVGAILTILVLVAATILIMRCARLTPARQALLVFMLPGLVGPMMLTHVHENHIFYGAVFALAAIPLIRDRRYAVALNALLLLWFVNLAGRYGLGVNSLSTHQPLPWLTSRYHDGGAALIVAWAAIAAYVVVLVVFARWISRPAGVSQPGPMPAFRERAVSGVE